MSIIRLNNVLMCSCDNQMRIELYEDRYSEDTLVNLETARIEELAFQPVLSIALLVGDSEDPEPNLGIVIDSKTIELTPEVMTPEPPVIKDFLELIDSETQIEVVDQFKKSDRVFHFMIRGNYPECPTIQIETASEVVTMMTAIPPKKD